MGRLIIGADLVPTDTNIDLFINGDIDALLGEELKQVLSQADYRIFNLEVPLTDVENPIQKQGPNLIAPTETINGYKAMKVDLLTLANNHILDQGQQGVISTCEVLDRNHISYVGVGKGEVEAAQPYIIEIDNKKIGVYACTEHEFSIVTENMIGANPYDSLESFDHVMVLKQQCDFVIVLYHGGKEHYRYPSPNLQKVCRKFVQKGANLVVCQHSHCIGCEEKFMDGTIVYGQGNFLFDHSKSEFWKTSILIQLDTELNISYIPLVKIGNSVRLAREEETKTIMEEFLERSKDIQRKNFIEEQYSRLAEETMELYLGAALGKRKNIFFRVINRLTRARLNKWLLKRRYNQLSKIRLINYIECEAHRELFLTGLKLAE